MIRINLLGIKREVSKKKMPSVSVEGAQAVVLLVLVGALGVGVLAVHFYRLTSQAAVLTRQLEDAKKEKARLEAVKSQYEQFQKKKDLLTKRINIIEGLKKGQVGPSTMLNALASTVQSSGQMWLTSFVNDGPKVSLQGMASNVNTVADFIGNLKRSGQFKNVEIRDTFEEAGEADFSTFVFSITAEVVQEPASGAASKT